MKTVSISEAARRLGRHPPAVYRLIESGAIRRLPGCRIPVADLEKQLPRQKRKLREVCFARIRLAGHDPRRILYILALAAESADADTMIHAGRFLLEGNPGFLRTLEADDPPMVEHRAPDGEGAPFVGLSFPDFIAGRIRLFVEKAPARIPPEAKAPILWKIFWPRALGRPFETFPLFRFGWIRLAPAWQNNATIFCQEQETVLSFASPVYRPTKAEKDAAQYMEKHFPEGMVWNLYGRDNITPRRLIVKAIIAARMEADEDPQTAVELLGELGVPPAVALDLARLTRRIIGKQSKQQAGKDPAKLQGAGPDPSGKGRILVGKDSRGVFKQDYLPAELIKLPMNRSAVAQALGISRPTLYAWTKAPRRSRQAAD